MDVNNKVLQSSNYLCNQDAVKWGYKGQVLGLAACPS